MKKLIIISTIIVTAFFSSCGGGNTSSTENKSGESSDANAAPYDAKKGIGKYTEESLNIPDKLDAEMAAAGEKVAQVKCFSCHKVTAEKLVGPGWKGVTSRHTLAWIMNFISDPDPMINKDPQLRAMLELYLVRMPNPSLTEQEARQILEFQRKIDGVK